MAQQREDRTNDAEDQVACPTVVIAGDRHSAHAQRVAQVSAVSGSTNRKQQHSTPKLQILATLELATKDGPSIDIWMLLMAPIM